MCSTFKFLLVAAVLSRVDAQLEALDRRIAYGASDVEGYAPVTKRNLPKGGMTVAELCAAAIEYSDNAAANLLLKSIGGPEGLTRFERSTGDTVTRSDRDEPTVNSNLPGDERDTTSPVAMLGEMRRCLIGNGLSAHSRQQLEDWLLECKTGATRLRAGIEPTWRIGDKTGTGDRGATNNIAIVWPPRRAPCLIAVYYSESTASAAARDSVIAEVGRIVSAALLVANKRH